MDHAGFHCEEVMEIEVVAAILDILRVGQCVMVINIFITLEQVLTSCFAVIRLVSRNDVWLHASVLGRFRW